MLSEAEVIKIARYLAERQLQVVSEGLLQVMSRWDAPAEAPVAPAGVGAFLAAEVAGRLGLGVLPTGSIWREKGVALPAAAAACLLAASLEVKGS
jgi:uncharacterized hydantoinase/oxoprolinase family protein